MALSEHYLRKREGFIYKVEPDESMFFNGGIEKNCSTFGCPHTLTPKEQLHGNKCTHCITKTSTPIDPTKFNGGI